MTTQKGLLTPIDAPDFRSVPTNNTKGWFWADTNTKSAFPGVHLERCLPEAIPPFATHMWGWGNGVFIRIRVDNSLESGFVALKLELDAGNDANCVVNTVSNASLTWGLQDHRLDTTRILTVRRLDNPATSVDFIALD